MDSSLVPRLRGQPGQVVPPIAGFALAHKPGNFLRRLALPRSVKHWPLRTLREKLFKIDARVVTHARYVPDGSSRHPQKSVRQYSSPHPSSWATAASAGVTGTTASTATTAQSLGERSVLNQGNRGQVPANIQNPRPRTFHGPPKRAKEVLTALIASIMLVQFHRRWPPVSLYGKSRLRPVVGAIRCPEQKDCNQSGLRNN